MAIIEPLRKDIINPAELKKHSRSLRLWHWLNLLVITGSLLTVLLNSTLFEVKSNTSFLQQQSGTSITTEQAKNIAHGIEDQIWSIHIYFGYALAALFLFRLLSIFSLSGRHGFFTNLKSAYQAYRKHSKQSNAALHEFTVKSLYLLFYLLLAWPLWCSQVYPWHLTRNLVSANQ
ncbi:cytochrome b/b6 domain-containing protein [Pedobacter sp. NJ-S-72]